MRNLRIAGVTGFLTLVTLGIGIRSARSLPTPSPAVTPSSVAAPTLPLRPATQPPNALDDSLGERSSDLNALLVAINHSLRYLQTDQAVRAYQNYPVKGVTRDRVDRSLRRFRQLLLTADSAQELQAAIGREFVFYQATGKDNQGTVSFTGYFEPVHKASRVRTADYRYPLYRAPGLKTPHPTRLELEGKDGLQANKGLLRGLELVWLPDRLEAFLVQVQGSARLQLTDGTTMAIGVAAHTNQPYTGIGRELVKDGKLHLEDLNLPNVVHYFQQHPDELDVYLPRNRRFVFFQNTHGAPAMGSLGVPVTAERSIATDKFLMPAGAIALMQTQMPVLTANQSLEQRPVSRFVLDQDTGGAIIGAGRVDIFMGTGKAAGDRAGLVNATGQLYYLLLK